jgi:hypothetical protein
MLSINVRKVAFSIIGIFGASFAAEVVFIFLAASGSVTVAFLQSSWFLIADAIVVNVLGIIVGLIWEKSTRARYLEKIKSSPAVSDRAKKIYKGTLVVAIVIGAIYILLNVWAVYEMLALGLNMAVSITTYTGLWIGLARSALLVLAFIWLSCDKGYRDHPSILDMRKAFILCVIFYIIMAIFNVIILANTRVVAAADIVTPQASTVPVGTVIQGDGGEISLSELHPALQQFAVTLPSGFEMTADGGNEVQIGPSTSTQNTPPGFPPDLGPYSVFVDAEVETVQNGVSSVENGAANFTETTTTCFGYPAEMVSETRGENRAETDFIFEPGNLTFFITVNKAASSSDPSLTTLNNNIDAIVASLKFEGKSIK